MENSKLIYLSYKCIFTCESRPMVINIRKNNVDHKGDKGIKVTAAGYTTKARPDPADATSSISTPSSLAMKPKTLNTTIPANKDVKQLLIAIVDPYLKYNVIYDL